MKFANWTPVSFERVTGINGFWKDRMDAVRETTVRVCLDYCKSTGRIANFRKAAGWEQGAHQGIYFDDSDVYKVLEGVAYLLTDGRCPALEQEADEIIDAICAAQWDDGYINTYYTLTDREKRWTDMARHEAYCIGHMVEGAIAYAQATGKTKWLDTAIRAVEHMMDVFGPGKRTWITCHQELELALVRLWRHTGRQDFLHFAQFLVEQRGHGHLKSELFEKYGFGPDYCQDDVPARELTRVTGHAVRAMYYYSALADIAAITADQGLYAALLRLWADVVPGNLYLTGGIGQDAANEGFTRPFHKPNLTAYCETCAAIGMALWNQRMNLLTGEAKYADLVETELYNGVLAGLQLDGSKFFYENPLSSVGKHHRKPWYGCSCCPTNLVRFVPSVGGYAYAVQDSMLVVNQFVPGTARVPMAQGEAVLTVDTRYPLDGQVHLHVTGPVQNLRLRKPGWCTSWTLTVNGKNIQPEMQNGYLDVPVQADDHIAFSMDMPVRVVNDDPRVLENQGRVAVCRGPLVYCAEECDNPGFVREYFHAELPMGTGAWHTQHADMLGGIVLLKNDQRTLIPYYAWDNREPGAMTVWMREESYSYGTYGV
ncbi:MAG: glycoside hydrolase family 127 protein [Christensenellales bacterium]|jgi:DUF1680 family protein